jgi:chorismate lyase / 3-hydroxybenzoate synthase
MERTSEPNLIWCSREDEWSLLRHDESIFALIAFEKPGAQWDDPRVVGVPLPVLGGLSPAEVWRSRVSVSVGREESIGFAESGDVLFAHLSVKEDTGEALADVVLDAYRRVLSFAAARGYVHVLRMWNVVPNLNEGEGDDERYKQFCVGRARAFEEILAAGWRPPAATCVGTKTGEIVIYFLASRRPGVPIENPQQVSADSYPRRYGPRSPSFSRAVLQTCGDRVSLHISGTASIVGHDTVHLGDPDRQLEETVRNIDAVVRRAAEKIGSGAPQLDQLSFLRVYLRHEEHFERVRSSLDRLVGPSVTKIFLRADLCRRSLLVEIEGFWCAAPS